MKKFLYLTLGKDLTFNFEYPFGQLNIEYYRDSSGDFVDIKSGWSFSINYKNALCNHRVIRMDPEEVKMLLEEDAEFMFTIISLSSIIVNNLRPRAVNLYDFCRLEFPENIGGAELNLTWYPVSEENKRVDQIYYSIL